MRLIEKTKHHKIYRDVEFNEYVVKFAADPSWEPSWYYTDDKDDAISTAAAMDEAVDERNNRRTA